ncbi:predicted protein [Chaetoceros tenuissimus]|uniref:Uncharacterized protein n=1 Tax=Chaetoceros tenuissimus TaxID=426638 RepID=A0AAD3D352_9STRA|nr:predicted protein [Chaetoceros tenuissimus]
MQTLKKDVICVVQENTCLAIDEDAQNSFTDPLNAPIDSIKVEVFGINHCRAEIDREGITGGEVQLSLNGNVLGQLASLNDGCPTCSVDEDIGVCNSSSGIFNIDPAWYNVGGSNEIKIGFVSGYAICVDRVELDLYTPTTIFTSNNLKITFSGFASGVDLASLFSELSTITKEAIRAALLAKGVAIDINDISISSSIVSISARNLLENESRSLQGTSSIQQDVNVNAPASAMNIGTINGNIATGITNSNNLAGVSAQASIVYEEPPWPCNGVTCSNAGKCEVLSHTEALCKCENTFVPSESGLECICPDDLNFHANVNRCLPPPTAAPSDLPSAFASLTPSSIPSDGKIDEEDTPS